MLTELASRPAFSPEFASMRVPPCGAWGAGYQAASFGNPWAQQEAPLAVHCLRVRRREPVPVFALCRPYALWDLGISSMTPGIRISVASAGGRCMPIALSAAIRDLLAVMWTCTVACTSGPVSLVTRIPSSTLWHLGCAATFRIGRGVLRGSVVGCSKAWRWFSAEPAWLLAWDSKQWPGDGGRTMETSPWCRSSLTWYWESHLSYEHGSHGAGVSGFELIAKGTSKNTFLQARQTAPGIVARSVVRGWSPLSATQTVEAVLEQGQSAHVGPQSGSSYLEEPGRTAGEDDDGVGPGLAILAGTQSVPP